MIRNVLTRFSALTVVAALGLVAQAQYAINWYTIDGGGGTSTGGTYILSGTIGQPDAGTMTGGTYALAGGFWAGIQPDGELLGDMNCNGFVEVGDIGGFVLAITNPAQYAATYPDCNINLADVNQNGFVEVGDIGAFVCLLTGC
ncbi:MAG: hypothetical protein SF069_02320 [Phycisphaerae bacterium]|nr:hypothetical protein [Phycisphaerae bacterium]